MKITNIGDSQNSKKGLSDNYQQFKINKAKSKKFRLIALLFWIVAISFEVWALFLLQKAPVSTTFLIVLIVLDLLFVILGSYFWKKANRYNPASSENKFIFFIQNQLGIIISVLAFLPLVIFIFRSQKLGKKQKAVLGSVATAALVLAGLSSADFNPPSVEKYEKQTQQVKELNQGIDYVYWTKYGRSYHLFSTCSYINSNRTKEIFEGTVANAKSLKNITDLCDRCQFKAENSNNN